MKIAVSFLSSTNYKEGIKKICASSADYIHVDFCDGKYVENKNLTMQELSKLTKDVTKMLDVHLMAKEPVKYANDLAFLNVDTVTFHPDACKDVDATIDYFSSIGIKVGLALNPDQSIDLIKPYLDKVDRVLIMSVVPGKGGQTFMQEVLNKFHELNHLKERYHFTTSIDGGINAETAELIRDFDIDVVVSGSFVTKNEDFEIGINAIKNGSI